MLEKLPPYRLLHTLFGTIMLVCLLELALEYRHHKLNYATPIFGQASTPDTKPTNHNSQGNLYGPTADFPFRSKVVPIGKHKSYHPVIWIASASHAEHIRLPAIKVFPNRICEFMESPISCIAFNGSRAGMSISDNIRLLEKSLSEYKPSIAILYQMSLAIEEQQRILTTRSKSSKSTSFANPLIDFKPISKLFQRTSIHQHLSDYVGGNIKLQASLKGVLPDDSRKQYMSDIRKFVEFCQNNNIVPILTTFATSHSIDNLSEMPRSLKTNFVRYNTYLSPEGWVNSTAALNKSVQTYAATNSISLIDINAVIGGRPEYFVDFVHFNETGHKIIAETISHSLTTDPELAKPHDI